MSITAPAVAKTGSIYAVRIDGQSSGAVSHTGLNYIFDMVAEWPIPAGTRYVEGSARVIPDTGTPNVRPGARVDRAGKAIFLILPARVANGSSYTPPSFEFELQATAAPGSSVTQAFARFSVKANVFLVGTLSTICDATPQPYPVAVTRIE